MRQAIFAALATFLAAVGIAGGSAVLADDHISPEPILASRHLIVRPPVLPEPNFPTIPAPPIVTERDRTAEELEVIQETRHEPVVSELVTVEASETASEAAPEPEPEPEPEVSEEPEQPADSGMGDGVEQWRGLVTAYFGGGLADTALCLMQHESGGNPNAQNSSSGASGLMQVLPSWAGKFGYNESDLFNPDVNLSISKALYDDGGWSHWSPYNRGECH